MKIAVTGSTGLVGSALVALLESSGHEVLRLVRAAPEGRHQVLWDFAARKMDLAALEGTDAVVHLAGESIASGRWTPEKKERIRRSRVEGTRFLGESLASLSAPPGVLVSASAVGYYGNRGDDVLREDSPPGSGFLAEVCRAWEAATAPAAARGIRVAILRLGFVLSKAGGGLAKMLPAFRMGAGGRVGSGRQFVSWIGLEDLLGAIVHALGAESLSGPINAVSPRPVRNSEFAAALGRVLSRPALVPLPAFLARALFGEMAEELLLSSMRVEPRRLLDSGFSFKDPEIEGALRRVLSPGSSGTS
jgi:uncharacterized protein (TIGR01777 family)